MKVANDGLWFVWAAEGQKLSEEKEGTERREEDKEGRQKGRCRPRVEIGDMRKRKGTYRKIPNKS